MRWLALIFGDSVYRLNSWLVAHLLRFRGVVVGKRFYAQGVPRLKIRGKASNIIIGDDVQLLGDIDLRNREQGKIVIEDGVAIDEGCRLVAANQATLRIGKQSRIGLFTVFNCGEDISVGEQTLISGFCYIQSSNHGIKKSSPIQSQPHTYGKIAIGSDVWLGSHVTVLPGVTIEDGAIIGAKAVVSKEVRANKIYAGVPAKEIGERP
jgi:acetyltransferase-like isoleucine patch superfamily enzyme